MLISILYHILYKLISANCMACVCYFMIADCNYICHEKNKRGLVFTLTETSFPSTGYSFEIFSSSL